jgi:enoyl-CoA hydratase
MSAATPSSSEPAVLERKDGAVTIISINRPFARNAVDPPTAQLLIDAFNRFENDDEARVLVLTGTGGFFCAGADLKAVSGGTFNHNPEGHGALGPSRMLLTKPSIAAVEGPAVAGGLELSLLCDLRVASETAVFGVYCRRWGVPLIDGGTVRLPRLIGQSRALDMILTGRAVKVDEAYQFGLANRVVPKGKALEEAVKLAKELAKLPLNNGIWI